jgi:hypothetical protein
VNTALIFGGLVSIVMIIVALARIVPELAIDSPLDLLLCFITRRGGSDFFTLVHAHITEGWPETKIDAVLLYGGLACLGFTLLIYFLKSYFAQLT